MDEATRELVAIAAAIAGKCQPCFDHHMRQARKLGISEDLIREAMQLARDIRASADNEIDEFAERKIKSLARNV